jgi:hypothetical protein
VTKTSATHLPICAAKAALTAVALTASAFAFPAAAQDEEPRGINNQADARDVALTPLSDLNLSRDPIPEVLLAARAAPYDQAGAGNCRDLARLVSELDTALGPDFDTQTPEDRGVSAGNIAQRIVGSFIPFRGLIREISGANEHERDFREAIAAGMMRRAYLKGRGQEMGCAYPSRPATAADIASISAERARLAAGEEASDDNGRRDLTSAGDNNGFYSEPVVQDVD